MQQDRDGRSLGELFSELSREMSRLFREEFTLAKKETTQKVTKASVDVAWLTVAGFVIYAGFLALIAAAIIGLAQVIAWAWSALAIGGGVVIIGGIVAWYYWSKLSSINPTPRQTVESLKEDKEWMKEQAQ